MTSLARLEELAAAAIEDWKDETVEDHGETWWNETDLYGFHLDKIDAEFIAAADPLVVAQLVQAVKAAQELVDVWRGAEVGLDSFGIALAKARRDLAPFAGTEETDRDH